MAWNKRKPRILLAVSERAAPRMSRVLAGLEFAARPQSLAQLVHALRCQTFDLIIVGSHFDGSRALEAVKAAQMHAKGARVACVRATSFGAPLGEATLAAYQAAIEALGVDGFVDVLQFPDDDAGNARVRAMLERLCAYA